MTDRQSKTVFVRNLPYDFTNEQLSETFQDVGPLKTAFIVADKESGKCKGYGYVQFSMLEDAVKAMDTVTYCGGRKVFVSFADAKKNWKKQKKGADNNSQEKTQDENGTKSTQPVREPKKKKSKQDTPKQKPVKRCRIILRNLAFKCKESDIRAVFEKFGTISEVSMPQKKGTLNGGFAFIQYTELKAAQNAVAKMNAQNIMGRPVAVDWAVAKDRFVASSHHHQSDQDSEAGSEEEQDRQDNKDSDEDKSDSEGSEEEESEEDGKDSNSDASDSEESDEEEEDDDDDEDDDEEDDDDDDEEEEKEEQERRKEKMKMERKSDVGEGRTLFIRNVPFMVEEEELEEVFEEFGEVVYVRLVVDKMTGQSRGTAFVQFADKESAEECVAKAQASEGGGLVVQGRQLLVVPAISRADAQNQTAASKNKEQKDNRNLFLAREGLIRAGTQAAIGVSEEDMKKRMKVELVKREKLKNLNIFVSSTRLCVHNLLPKVDEKELKKVLLQFVDDPTVKITECRVMRDLARVNQSGMAKSLGFAFVNFSTHEHALKALHALNNSTVFGDQRRPIVEFSLENKKALEAKQKRLEKSRAQAAKKQQERESETAKPKKLKAKADKTQDRIAKAMHPGAPKGMPKRFGPKIRHKKRQQQQQQVGKKQKKKQQQQQPGKKQKQQLLNRPNQQPKPRMRNKKKKKEITDKVDKMISKRQGKKSRWFETS